MLILSIGLTLLIIGGLGLMTIEEKHRFWCGLMLVMTWIGSATIVYAIVRGFTDV